MTNTEYSVLFVHSRVDAGVIFDEEKMMSRVFVLMCVVSLIAGCGRPETQLAPPVALRVHYVKVKSVTTLNEVRNATGNAGENALLGSIAGAAVGLPTVGAVVGASTTDGRRAVVSTDACKFQIELNGSLLYFIGGKSGEGSYSDVETCSLLTPGDVVEVHEYANECPIRMSNRGDPKSVFRWREFCLRDAI